MFMATKFSQSAITSTTQLVGTALCTAVLLTCGIVHAQDYPSRAIRVVTAEAGGASDIAIRVMGQAIAPSLGQQIVVDNRGGGTIAGEVVAHAAPDGYTLLYYGNTLWLLPLMRHNVPYDPQRDFEPISYTLSAPNALVVHPSLPVKSVRELIALARARPGELNYGSAALGTSNHISAELFKSMTKTRIVRVSYKGIASAMNALLSGDVQLVFPTAAAASPYVTTGRLKVLAITSAQPSPSFPKLPTLSASGVPGYESVTVYGMFAPAHTPAAIVSRLNREFVSVLNRPEIKERFAREGIDVVASTPEGLTRKIQTDVTVLGKVISDAGIHEE
jgi:tripartite-type tricarboxylate transporter receptor subunit TctC